MNAVIVDAVIVCRSGYKSPQPGSEEPWGGVAGGVVSLGDEEGEVSSTMKENNGGCAASDTISAGGGAYPGMKIIFSLVNRVMLVEGCSSEITKIEKGCASLGIRRGMWVASTGMPQVAYVPAHSV
jgi:hypothetical protein